MHHKAMCRHGRSRLLCSLLAILVCRGCFCHAREVSAGVSAEETTVAELDTTISKPSSVASTASQRPRRMMQDVDRSLENTQIPRMAAPRFTKLAASVDAPLGTAINGSAWVPGACGDRPSALGYQCSWVAPGGAVLHWTYSSSSSSPPINRCTMQQQAVPSLDMQELSDGTVHFALQAASQEQLHLVFLDPEARVYPNEGAHGSASAPCNNLKTCKSTSIPEVEVLLQTAPGASTVTSRPSSRDPALMEGWAGWVSADTDGRMQVLCLSRHVHTKLMKLGPQQSTELLLGYAVGNNPNYMTYGQQKGMVAIALTTGRVTVVDPPSAYLLAHGALMLIAYGVLLPTGLLLARHKWLFVDEELGLSPLWSLTHLCVLLLAALVGLTGMVVALVRFGSTVSGLVMSTHQVLGLLAVGMSLVLAITYGLRPFLVGGSRHAPSPLLGPQKVGGCITVAAGWASLFLGCVVVHRHWASPYHVWLVPCVLLTALVAAAATLLELRYQRLLRCGAYDPRTCTLSNAGPSMPLAVIRTRREPTNPKKQDGPDSECSSGGGDGGCLGGSSGGKGCFGGHHSDVQHGFAGISGSVVAATILARSLGTGGGSSPRHHSDAGLPGPSRGLGGSGGGSAGGSGSGELLFRRARHSSPNAAAAAAAAAAAQTGFPSSPGTQPYGRPSDGNA